MKPDKNSSKSLNPLLKIGIAGVALLGVAFGAYSLVPQVEISSIMLPANGSASGVPCAISDATYQKLKTLSIGEMKAFAPMDRSYSLAEFRFKDESGAPKTVANWTGRTILVNLWATWCAPCRAEMPFLDALQGKLGSDKFEVLPISVDRSEPSKPKAFFEEISIKEMGFFHDENAMTLNALKREGLALGLPATLLVDGRGCAIGRLNGPAEWASADAQNLIKAAF